MSRLLTNWQAQLDSGQIRPDPGQNPALHALASLADRLDGETGLPALFWPRSEIWGLYIWGSVGGGKSMLMDLFFDSLTIKRKKRVHFHAFMQRVHALTAQWRQRDKTRHKAMSSRPHTDPIPAVAKGICAGTRVLCFDEFHVNDIADAMLLGRLFEQIFAQKTIIIATSNQHPDDLYKDGLNRDLFKPFIHTLKQHTQIIALKAQQDYRLDLGQKTSQTLWHTPLDAAARAHMATLWQHIIMGMPAEPTIVEVNGRTLPIPQAMKGYARIGFADLCAKPLGASDYIALASRFHTLLLEDIPIMGPERRNEAARFVTLIDTLYEAKTCLIVSAAAEPDALYQDGHGASAFKRTASRLHEMRRPGFARAIPDLSAP